MKTNKINVNIAGVEYNISTSESREYVLELASKIETQVKEIMENNPNIPINSALVLCCMSYLDEAKKLEKDADNLRSQIKEYI